MKCSKCGKEFKGNFCPNCGNPAEKEKGPEESIKQKDKINSILLGAYNLYWNSRLRFLFIGAFGAAVCLFIMGHIWSGIAMIICGVLLTPAIQKKSTDKQKGITVILTIVCAVIAAITFPTEDSESVSGKPKITAEESREDTKEADQDTKAVDQNTKAASQEKSVEFEKEWYKKYTHFQDSETGDTLEMEFLDGGYVQCVLNGTVWENFMDTDYEEQDGECYVYSDLMKGDQIKYHPTNGNYIEIISDGVSTSYYPVEQGEEDTDSVSTVADGYYVTDTVPGNEINAHIFCAYFKVEYGSLYINVLCDIYNNSSDDITFDAGKYFELNNNGVISSGFSDYDYSQLASGAKIQTTVKFMYPENASIDFQNMIMTVDGTEVSLADKPQEGEELNNFYGIYNRDKREKIIIEPLADGSYNLIDIMYWEWSGPSYEFYSMKSYNVTLNSDNTFFIGNGRYQWNPETHSIKSDGSDAELYK